MVVEVLENLVFEIGPNITNYFPTILKLFLNRLRSQENWTTTKNLRVEERVRVHRPPLTG